MSKGSRMCPSGVMHAPLFSHALVLGCLSSHFPSRQKTFPIFIITSGYFESVIRSLHQEAMQPLLALIISQDQTTSWHIESRGAMRCFNILFFKPYIFTLSETSVSLPIVQLYSRKHWPVRIPTQLWCCTRSHTQMPAKDRSNLCTVQYWLSGHICI